jgi:hypothetical protein
MSATKAERRTIHPPPHRQVSATPQTRGRAGFKNYDWFPQMEPGKCIDTGGLRDGSPRRLLRHYAAGDPDGTRTDCLQAAHLMRQRTVKDSSEASDRCGIPL